MARVIEEEPRWRHKPVVPALGGPPQRVIATRWRAFQRHTLEVQAESAADFHVIGIALRRINIRLSFCGRVVQDGVFMPGMLIVNEPSLAVHGLLRGPTDVLHLHIPNEVLVECASHIHPRGTATLPSGSSTGRDPAIERLGMALLGADELGSPFGRLYAEFDQHRHCHQAPRHGTQDITRRQGEGVGPGPLAAEASHRLHRRKPVRTGQPR